MNPYLFLVGCSRSGTSLLKRMIDAHPDVRMISAMGWIPRGGTLDELDAKGKLKKLTPPPVDREALRGLSYADMVGRLFDRHGEAMGKGIVGTKGPVYTRNMATLHELFPRARFVHIVRDGRDVARSAINWRRAESLAEDFATWRVDPVSTAALWWEWQVRLGREGAVDGLYHEARYERLVEDPDTTCRELCEFLDVGFDDAMLRFNEGREREAADAKHSWKPVTQGLRDWRTEMSPEDVERFEAVAGALLDELGYERATDASPTEHSLALRKRFEGRPLPERW